MRDPKYGTGSEILKLPAAAAAAILRDSEATTYAKAKACQRLAMNGPASAVPAIAPLLEDPQLSHYARIALEPMPPGAADDALRAALGRVSGPLLVGVINTIGHRRDVRAIGRLAQLLSGADTQVAQAANEALARIRPGL
jgi:hypothetical protein